MASSRLRPAQSESEADPRLVALARLLGRLAAREVWGAGSSDIPDKVAEEPGWQSK
jgi:hypothetical protein